MLYCGGAVQTRILRLRPAFHARRDADLYVGFTTDLQRRLTEHFHGESKATAPRRPFRLIFCEYFISREDAERREGYLKTTAGRKGLKLILRDTLKSRVWD